MSQLRKLLILSGIIFLGIKGWAVTLYPQAGTEYYFGANKFRSLKPWIGLRLSLSSTSSFLLKYTHHVLSFNYPLEDDLSQKREATLSQFIGAFYQSKATTDIHLALSYFHGSEDYTALNLDGGAIWKLAAKIGLEGGFYLLDESSILWYPNDPKRRIRVGAIRGGIDLNLFSFLKINSVLYLYRNSEKIKARTLAVSLILIPRDPFYLVFTFWDYRESATYHFSGQYLSFGLHIYY
ncbi:MAG: hypothetical protein N3B16_00610 [Candidatus Aminicenantes bacterium]|nr:hypothetical protein [Candidatus Aminicenantes bacterium]